MLVIACASSLAAPFGFQGAGSVDGHGPRPGCQLAAAAQISAASRATPVSISASVASE
jgi:hypothetical protein